VSALVGQEQRADAFEANSTGHEHGLRRLRFSR